MNKKFCVLQVAPEQPNQEHFEYFHSKKESDFYFVTHDKDNKNALKYCPNTKWSETRNILMDMVPKNYDYYAFIDYDYILRPQRNLGVLEQIIEDLQLNPAVLTYYPGKNLQTPYALDEKYYKSRDYSCIPFTHMGLKIVHNSLIKWFFPLYVKHLVDIDACHMFNIMELPFLKNVICSHKMIYDNGFSNKEALYNKNSTYSKIKMDEMWNFIRPAFKKNYILQKFISSESQIYDSLFIKEVFVNLFHDRISPEKEQEQVNYYDLEKISKFFDLDHEFFKNKYKGDINGR